MYDIEVKPTDEEIKKAIESINALSPTIVEECTAYHGQIDDLYRAIGMLVVGQLFGWRVMRLVTTRTVWTKAAQVFGDPKKLMVERGCLAEKSLGLRAADKLEDYWQVIQGHATVDPEIKRTLA